MQNAITILSLIVAIISGITGILWSIRYKESKQAELDAKDAEISAKVAELKSMLQIQLLEYGSSPVIMERYRLRTKTLNEINYGLITEVDDLKNANEILLKQVREAISSNQRFSESIPVLTVPEDVKSTLSAFVTGSEKIIIDIGQSVYNILLVGESIKRNADMISKVTAMEIDTSTTETVTGSDLSKIEIADPESDNL